MQGLIICLIKISLANVSLIHSAVLIKELVRQGIQFEMMVCHVIFYQTSIFEKNFLLELALP